MATLSRKTVGIATRAMEWWSQPTIEQFFYEHDVPDKLVLGKVSKLKQVLNVFQGLERKQEYGLMLTLIEQALPRLRDEQQKELQNALLRDGFAVGDDGLIDAEPDEEKTRTAVGALLDAYKNDFACETLFHHLHESEDLFRQEKWDSSISHCRNFVEQLLVDIAKAIATELSETPDLSRPVRIRQYLEDKGFFDEPERKKLVDGVYGYFSEEGSHPGISTQSAARVAKSILSSFAYYVLEKYDAWKTEGLTLQ